MQQVALAVSCLYDASENSWTEPLVTSYWSAVHLLPGSEWMWKKYLTHKIIALTKSIILIRLRKGAENRKKK